MSTMKKHNLTLKSGKKYEVNIEKYNTAQELVQDCQTRPIHYKKYDGTEMAYEDMSKKDIDKDWHGVRTYDEALELLKTGYQPTVEKLQTALKANVLGSGKRVSFENNVHGFAPVVPLALKGVPNSMVNMTMKQIKCKVVDVYYDMTTDCGTTPQIIIECGQKLLGTIIELEKQGYRFNLYALQSYTNDKGADMLCVKIKSSDKPIDIKRISFPLTHPAFFRVIGFDWEGKSPITRYIGCGRGRALTYSISDAEASDLAKQTFGDNAIYISCNSIKHKDEKYIKEVLVG